MADLSRKKGAPKGNQYARKHGFYSRILTPAQLEVLRRAGPVYSIKSEIVITMLKIHSVLKTDPSNTRLLHRAVNRLIRLIRQQENIKEFLQAEAAGASETIDHYLSRITAGR